MQFSNFSRLEEGLTITLYNQVPMENVGEIKYYTDNSNGSFNKKEFRWSFNNEHWASWEPLTQSAISRINTFNNYYFFLQIRYTLNAIGSGTITTFNVNYKEGTATPITPRVLHEDIQHLDSSAVLIHDILQTYKTIPITDASLLEGKPGSYYLNRSNHIGSQPISSITNLQSILNGIVSQKYVKESSLGTAFIWDSSGFLDVSIMEMDYNYIDGSLLTRDSSIESIYNSIIEGGVNALDYFYTKEYIDSSFYNKSYIDSSFYTIYHSNLQGILGGEYHVSETIYNSLNSGFSGTFLSDGSTVTVSNGIIISVV